MSRFVCILVLLLVAGITSTDTVAQSTSLSVTSAQRFEELDTLTGAIFAAQALVAPRTLRSVVPLYTYKIEDALKSSNSDRLRARQRGFIAIICQPNSRNEYTGYPIVSAESDDSTEQRSQLAYKDIQGLIKTVATTPSQQSGQAGDDPTNFGVWQRQHCSQKQNTLLLGTSYPISGATEVARLWTRRGYWNKEVIGTVWIPQD